MISFDLSRSWIFLAVMEKKKKNFDLEADIKQLINEYLHTSANLLSITKFSKEVMKEMDIWKLNSQFQK